MLELITSRQIGVDKGLTLQTKTSPKKKKDVWSTDVEVESSSYVWEGNPIVFHRPLVRDLDKPLVVELFCGCGGTSSGFEMAGYQVALGVDHLRPAVDTFFTNHKSATAVLADITKLESAFIKEHLGGQQVDVLIGGVPCQGFSLNNRKRHEKDKRNLMYEEFVRIAEALQPRAVVLENVSGMQSTGNVVQTIEKELSLATGMTVTSQLLYAPDYGVPQHRTRLLFIGVKGATFDFTSIQKTHGPETNVPYNTVYDALSDLPHLEANDKASTYMHPPITAYQKLMRANVQDHDLTNHIAPNHPASVVEMIRNTPQGEPMYKKYKQRIRLKGEDLSPTQVAGGIRPSFQFAHPTDDRGLTIRERCRLQSFPDDFIIKGGIVQGRVQTGNAVPPLLAKAIAEAIKKYL